MTERDREILRWLGRHRYAMVSQIMNRFVMSQVMAYRRLGGMVTDGYLSHQRLLHGEPGVYWPTRAGLAAAECGLPVATVDIRTYRHDLLLVWLAIEMESLGGMVVTEREMRQAESFQDNPDRFAVLLNGRGVAGYARKHFPDLVVEGQGKRLAVEVELTSKRTQRLEAILRGYAWARHLDGVVYYVDRPSLAERITEISKKMRVDDKVKVEVLRLSGAAETVQ